MGNPVRFGDFEVDLRAGELLKRGHKIKLQEKPFQILEILLEQPGEMVGRQELAERLWPADTFVDFERGLNTAIGKLRTALGDSAEKPRYIETVARRGYRFIGSIEGSESEEPSSGRRWSPALVTLAFVVLGTALVLGLRGGFIVEAPTEVIDSVAVLIDATPEEHLWTETYERDLRDVLALQSEVARRIADEIRVKLTPQEAVRLASARPVDPEAHDAYLRGLFYFHEAINHGHRLDRRVELHKRSLEQFRQAIEIEPDYAQAYAGVARSHHWLASFGFPESYPKAKEAALKALEIDETIADAHSALAFTLHNYDWDWPGAEGHYNQAIELNPNAGNAGHHGYAIYLSAAGRHSEAITMIQTGRGARSACTAVEGQRSNDLHNGTAVQTCDTAGPARCRPLSGWCSRGMRRSDELTPLTVSTREALAEFQVALDLSSTPTYKTQLAWGLAVGGKRGRAEGRLDDLIQKHTPIWNWGCGAYNMARLYAALGKGDHVFEWLNKAFDERTGVATLLKVSPEFDDLHSDPRFQDLLRRINYPE